MTLRDLFTDKTLWAKYGDMDVYNDCIDDMASAWCGTIMTFEGAEHYDKGYKYSNYGKILDTPIEISAGTYCFDIEVHVDDYPDYSKRWNYISQIFSDAAGYCTEEEYDTWFIDDYDNEETPKDDGKETNAGYDILTKLSSQGSGYEEGYVLGFKQKSTGPEWVTWGYHKRPNEEPSYYWGHYFRDKEAAQKDLLERMSGMLNNMEVMI